MGFCRKATTVVLSLAQVAGAIAIVYIISEELYHVQVTANGVVTDETCLLEKTSTDENLCRVGFSGVALTFAATIVLALLQCLTCDFCGAGPFFDGIVSAILCAGWACYSAFVVSAHNEIQDLDPQPAWNTDDVESYRKAIVALSFIQTFVFAVLAGLGFSKCCCSDD